jgi:PPM family protein phosphatase
MGTVIGGAHRAIGPVRAHNEDTYRLTDPAHPRVRACGYLAILADGMGGHGQGDVASDAASDGLFARYYAEPPPDLDTLPALLRARGPGRRRTRRAATAGAMGRAPGTTLVAAAVRDDLLFVANVGDSRAYLARGGAALQLTRDHSLVAEQVAAGMLDQAEAANTPRNVITRALGQEEAPETDIFTVALQPDDRIILCSDGVHGHASPADIAALTATADPQAASEALVNLALARGTTDNASAVVLWYRPGEIAQEQITRPLAAATG